MFVNTASYNIIGENDNGKCLQQYTTITKKKKMDDDSGIT